MYCEKCKRVIEANPCPFCKSRKVRELEPDDICFLPEQDYVSTGVLEDVLRQNNIRRLPQMKPDRRFLSSLFFRDA